MTGRAPSSMELSAHLNLLSLFARLLATEIDPALYRRLREHEPVPIEPAIAALAEADAVAELGAEYCRLFIGPRPACPPYPSVRRGGAVLGAAARRFTEFLARQDLQVLVSGPHQLLTDDHLAVQLTVFRDLARTAADPTQLPDARRRAIPQAAELTREHLRPALAWFAPRLAEATSLAPYAAIAALVVPVVDEVTAWISANPEPTG